MENQKQLKFHEWENQKALVAKNEADSKDRKNFVFGMVILGGILYKAITAYLPISNAYLPLATSAVEWLYADLPKKIFGDKNYSKK